MLARGYKNVKVKGSRRIYVSTGGDGSQQGPPQSTFKRRGKNGGSLGAYAAPRRVGSQAQVAVSSDRNGGVGRCLKSVRGACC